MYKKRLRMLKEMLENHDKIFPDVEFNMSSWIKKRTCGTAACALGSATSYVPFKVLGLKYHKTGIDVGYPRYKKADGFVAGQRFFGLTSEDCFYLFDPDQYSRRVFDITEKHVIKHIDKLLAR